MLVAELYSQLGKTERLFRSEGSDINRLTFTENASNKWIANETTWATAYGVMVYYFTNGTFCARSRRTRICTFLINACSVLWTIGTNYTFSSTIWWHTNIARLTWAHRMLIDFMANTVWPTHMGRTYIYWRWYGCYKGMDFSCFCYRFS